MSMELFNEIDKTTTVNELNALYVRYDSAPIFSRNDDYLIRNRFDQKYIEVYLNLPDSYRPKWLGKLIAGNINPIEIDVCKNEMIITHKGVKYTAIVSKGLKFSQAIIPIDVLNIFEKYILSEVGNACRGILLYNSYATVSTVV